MNPQELSAFIANLLRGGPEVLTSFLTGLFFACMVAYAFHRWFFPGHDSTPDLARKDAEIARKDGEIFRKDAQIVCLESKVDRLEQIQKQPHSQDKMPAINSLPLTESLATRYARLELENRQLEHDKKSLEETVENLKTELAHAAKWLERYEERYAQLRESQSLAEG